MTLVFVQFSCKGSCTISGVLGDRNCLRSSKPATFAYAQFEQHLVIFF